MPATDSGKQPFYYMNTFYIVCYYLQSWNTDVGKRYPSVLMATIGRELDASTKSKSFAHKNLYRQVEVYDKLSASDK